MAGGSRLGDIYVQVSLDDKEYKKKLAEMPANAQATEKGLDATWRALGVKTNQYFEDSRKAAENAYKLIEKSGKYSADEMIRAERAKNDQITRLNEQQFGTQTSLISSLKSHYIAVTAAIAVAIGGISKAWDLAKAGADFKEQEGILNNLARKYDTTADDIVSAMEKASDGLVSRADLMSVALGGLAKGLDPTQLTDLADAAQILGDTVGMSATESLKQLTTALETGRTKGLKMFMGSAIDLEATMGDLYSKMTESEKTQALYNITMIEAKKLQAEMTGEVDSAADRIELLEAKYANIKTTVGVFAMKTLVGLVDGLKAVFSTTSETEEMVDEFGQTIDRASLSTETLASKIWKWAVPAFNAWMESEEEAEARILATMNQTTEANKSLTSHTDNINADADANKALIAPYQATIDKLKDQIKSREGNKKAVEDGAKAAKKAADEEVKAAKEAGDAYLKNWGPDAIEKADAYYAKLADEADKEAKHRGDQAVAAYNAVTESDAKLLAQKETDATAYKKLITGEADFAETENERAINKIIADHGAKMTALNTLQEGGNITYQQYVDGKATIDKNYNLALINQAETARDKVNDAAFSIYSTGTGYGEEAYEFAVEKIEAQVKKYEDMKVPAEAVAKYIKDAMAQAHVDMLKKSGDWKDGMNGYFEEVKLKAKKAGEYMFECMESFGTASKKAVSDTLFDGIKTGTVDIQKIWGNFSDTILRTFTDCIGDMVKVKMAELMQPGLNKLGDAFDGLWTATKNAYTSLVGDMGDTDILGKLKGGWDKFSGMFTSSSSGLWDTLEGSYGDLVGDMGDLDVMGTLDDSWDSFSGMFTDSNGLWDSLSSGYDDIVSAMGDTDISGTLMGGWDTFSDALTGEKGFAGIASEWSDTLTGSGGMLGDFTSYMGSIISAAGEEIKMTFTAVWNAASIAVIGALKALAKWLGDAWDSWNEGGLVPQYAYGLVPGRASVPGDSPRNDTHLALVSPGEFIMPRSAVNATTMPYLDYMRTNKKPYGYFDGGPVSGDEEPPPSDYNQIYADCGMAYKNQTWNAKRATADGWAYDPISDPITYAAKYLDDKYYKFLYGGLQPADPSKGLTFDDYKYLLDWVHDSYNPNIYTAPPESMDPYVHEYGVSPISGSMNPNVLWIEQGQKDDYMHIYMRNGEEDIVNPGESNWLKRYMPAIIQVGGHILMAVMTYMASLPVSIAQAGVNATAYTGLLASGYTAMQTAAIMAAHAGAAGVLTSLGNGGSVAGALISGLISAVGGYYASTAVSSGNGLGIADWATGKVIQQSMRFGAKALIKDIVGDMFSFEKPSFSLDAGGGGGLGQIGPAMDNLPDLMSGSVPLASGIDYVPYDNFPARLHKGERVLTKEENKQDSNLAPVLVNFILDGKVLASTLYKQSKAGIKIIHERGLAYA
jgi:hypothetical protein